MRVGTEQERLLNCIVRANRDCWYGKQFDFAKLRSVEDFQRAVPVCRYDDLRSPLERIASGEGRVLTGRPVTLFEPTGGTAANNNLFVDSLKDSVAAAFLVAVLGFFFLPLKTDIAAGGLAITGQQGDPYRVPILMPFP